MKSDSKGKVSIMFCLKIIHKLIHTVHIYVSRHISSPKVENMKPVVATIFKSVGLIQPGCVFIYCYFSITWDKRKLHPV